MLTVIIPTYNEQRNVAGLAGRIVRALADTDYEILFVDDSTDNTPQVLTRLCRINRRIRFIHRPGRRGLASAVATGFAAAGGDVLAVMDADLQHPPEMLPVLLRRIQEGSDLVIASRFVPGGSNGGLSLLRRLVSNAARLIGQLALKDLRRTSDPMSGFFMFKKEVIAGVALAPLGWKILAEIMVRGHFQHLAEVPYTFRSRREERSKMNLREQVNYLRHILRLVADSPEDLRFWKFCLVGTSGVVVNMVFFFLFTRLLSLGAIPAALGAAVLAMSGNFLFNDHFTWNHRKEGNPWERALKFYLCCGLGVLINVAVLAALHGLLRLPGAAANAAGILAATIWNYYANNRWTWAVTLPGDNPDRA
ncbi:glycosyltransferase [Desulfotomaculum copahuensis]|uniref:Dolichol monophosphate mannose synthase n=1 Tax=Desulfotomaculum copahuensis TaxID=1838280 RepID=A0A1B7LHU4_9FIRM|nr:glycosyltransferase family 2 protein [Desulfotomaculum copahuensis]OAT85828.1 hypothetical protein A6M21_04940 [Desulfotomaculum copahuensis]